MIEQEQLTNIRRLYVCQQLLRRTSVVDFLATHAGDASRVTDKVDDLYRLLTSIRDMTLAAETDSLVLRRTLGN